MLFSLFLFSFSSFIFADASCGPGWEQKNQKCYKIFTSEMNFIQVRSANAQKVCAAVGGQIVSIHSEEENILVGRIVDEDYMLCNGINVPLAEAHKMDEIAKHPLFCTPKSQWLFLSFIIGFNRRRDGHGGYVSTLVDGSQATFGNVPEHRGKDSQADYPWSAQQPSGTLNWNYNDEPAEECAQMWHPCGWWNDIQCARADLAGVICQKNAA